MLVVWSVEIVGFSFSEGLRILTRKPGVREGTGFLRNCLPVHDVMRSFSSGFRNDIQTVHEIMHSFFRGTQLSSRQRGCPPPFNFPD